MRKGTRSCSMFSLIMIWLLIMSMMIGCFPVFLSKKPPSVSFSAQTVKLEPGQTFSVALMLEYPVPFRAAGFEIVFSEGISVVDIEAGSEYVGYEVLWGQNTIGNLFAHLGFLGETITGTRSGTVLELNFVAENEGSISLSEVMFVDDNLDNLGVLIKQPSQVSVLLVKAK